MGEKAQDQGRSFKRLPAGGAVGVGALVGAVLAAPIALAVTSGGDDDVVAAGPTTTIEQTTTTEAPTTTEALPTNPQGTFTVTLTVVSSEIASDAFDGNEPMPEGSTLAGGTLDCDGAVCEFALTVGNLGTPISIALTDGRGSADFTYSFDTGACAGTGTTNGTGTVTLVAGADGYGGEVTIATEVFDSVPGDGTFCTGSRNTMSIATTPA